MDGSFVTTKPEPFDVDAVVQIPANFEEQVALGLEAAIELEEMLLTRRPEEIFAAEDDDDWRDWIEFFSRTREARCTAQGPRGNRTMIANPAEYQKAQEEIRSLEERLQRLQQEHPLGSKGFTKAGIRKLIARLHEELAVYEGSEDARRPSEN